MKRVCMLTLFALLAAVVLSACGVPQEVEVTRVVTTKETVVEKETVVVEKEVVVTAVPEQEEAQAEPLVLAAHTDVLGLDPGRVFEIWGSMLLHNMYDTLLTVDPQDFSKVVPSLAAEWEASPDAMEYNFKLRPDVKFTTGNPLTAEDVVWSLQRVINLKSYPASLLADVDTIEAVDDLSVKITLSQPNAILPYILTTAQMSIMDSKTLIEHGGLATADAADADKAEEYLLNNSVGSGPYMLASNEPDYKVVLKMNPGYWGEPAKTDEVIVLTVSDPTAQRFMVEQGDADIVYNLSAEQVNAMEGNPAVQIVLGPTFEVIDLEMTQLASLNEALSNPLVQQAVRYAMDYEGFFALAGGYGNTVCGVIPPASLGALPEDECIQRDVEKAKALLAEAGYADGLEGILTYESTGVWHGVSFSSLAEKVQADLAEIGVVVTLDPQEGMVAYQKSREQRAEMFVNVWMASHSDGGAFLEWFCPGQGVAMRYGYALELAPEIDEKCKAARGIADAGARAEAYQEIQRMFLEQSPWVAMLGPENQSVAGAGVEGFAWHPAFVTELKYISK